jgi:SAM-dependent methyltransferase
MTDYTKYFSANKDLWNKRTIIHKDSTFYDVAGFKAGKNVLTPIELTELGVVQGKNLLHLQCHFGMDSLNWARLGAHVTGIDLSDEAIKEAKKLNDELKMNAKFICCNIYDLHPQNIESSKILPFGDDSGGTFDIVFTSYGVIGWLPDLDKWAEIISYYLKPGGTFYMAEFHPVIWMFDDDFKEIKYCYENRE